MSEAVDMFARLTISNDAATISVEAEHARVRIDIEQLDTAMDLINQGPHPGQWRKSLDWFNDGLRAVGLDVYVCLAGRPIARLGTHARSGLTSRLLGLGAVELRPLRAGMAWWQSKRR